MAQHHVDAERDVAADAAEQQRVELRAQQKTKRPGKGAAEGHDRFVLDHGPESAPADHELGIARGPGTAGLEQLLLDDCDPALSVIRSPAPSGGEVGSDKVSPVLHEARLNPRAPGWPAPPTAAARRWRSPVAMGTSVVRGIGAVDPSVFSAAARRTVIAPSRATPDTARSGR